MSNPRETRDEPVSAPTLEALVAGNRGLSPAGDLEARVDALLSRMSLEEKLFEMHGLQSKPIEHLYHAGGNDELGIPVFRMVDGPRGVRAGRATAFPVAMARGASFDLDLERRVGLAMGRETLARGGNVLLAPCINLPRHPGWGRAQESYSEDPFHMGWMAVAFVGGVQNHVLASAKHFAVNSIENTRFEVSANLSERTLRELYLPHFERVVRDAAVASVMSAYNRVNGTYCGEHPHLLSDILKGEWGFDGFVESDWILGTRSTAPAVAAGLDVEMPRDYHFKHDKLRAALEAGELSETQIDDAVRRVLRQKLRFELDRPAPPETGVVECAEHRALALEAAHKSIVLLKNEGVLPVDAGGEPRVVVVGALADVANLGDRGSSYVRPSASITPFAGLAAAAPGLELTLIDTDTPDAAQLETIAGADLAIVVAGLTYKHEGEFIPTAQQEAEAGELTRGGDRADLRLPEVQERLIHAVAERASETVVVLEAGSALLLRPWIDEVEAVLMAWYPGMQGGQAIGDIVFGHVSPSGKLPLTFPRDPAQLPAWDITSKEVAYDDAVGYRRLDLEGAEPEMPFGFGLSYTRFELSDLALDGERLEAGATLGVEATLTNVGDRSGDEVVQLYVGYPPGGVQRPVRELAGFVRVSLSPGQARRVRFALPADELRYYDEAAGAWALSPGRHTLWVGKSSRELPLEASFDVG